MTYVLADQQALSPLERVDTLPAGLPELTLGWGVIRWMANNLVQPNGERAGGPFIPTLRQTRFLLWAYAVDTEGRWLFNRLVRRLAKGSGKSPFAAAMAVAELLGPVRLDKFDPSMPGGCVGKPVVMPVVQVAATSERQTGNTMRMVRAFCNKKHPLYGKFGLFTGRTFVDTAAEGRLEQITSSASTAEGAESSFCVADETEHWTPGVGGPTLMATLAQNSAKTGARVLETSNAWVPGQSSVSEDTFNTWVDQQEQRTYGTVGVLYDARVAPPNTALTDEPTEGQISLTEGLEFVYEDCPWVDINNFKSLIWSTNYAESRSRRFFLNQPNAAEDSWLELTDWTQLHDPHRELIPGEDVVLFFDGSKSNDNTALVGCCVSDGHVFTVGVWEPDETTGVIDVEKVESAIDRVFNDFQVKAFWADVREWESYVKSTWPEKYGEQLVLHANKHGKEPAVIAWDMRSHSWEFAEAAEMCKSEILVKSFTHDGNWMITKHIGNAKAYESRGRTSIKKESPKSSKKIDGAVCVIGARMVYRALLASKEYTKDDELNYWTVY